MLKVFANPLLTGPAAGTDAEKVAAFDDYVAYYGT
jgi:hypothetical protein